MTEPGPREDTKDIVHLHVHSEYSLVDGAIRIGDLIDRAKKLGHQAVAITDHGNMYGAVEFYSKAKDYGIKPIIGVEIYHAGRTATLDALKALGPERPEPWAFHLVLLAKSAAGYKNLCRVVSSGYLESPVEAPVPIIPEHRLDSEAGDLIALSGCLKGEFGTLLQLLAQISVDPIAELSSPSGDAEAVVAALREHVAAMRSRFGADGYYIELIDNNLPEQRAALPLLVAAARHFGLPLVATGDAHYLDEGDSDAHAVLTGIKNDLTISAIRSRRKNATFHVYSNEEMEARYGAWPDALANTTKIAAACNVQLEFGKYFLPNYELEGDEQIDDALRRLAREGLEERLKVLRPQYGPSFDETAEKKYWDRLEYETNVIISMGFPGYFLIVQDFINWAKKHDIPVGPGRGSGAGSLVAYALRITDLDPIPFNLIFERFLNPERVSMPDFDVDFCQDRRGEVIQYVTRKYGAASVAQITTFGKMKAKAVLRDVGRVLELGYSKVDRIAKLIPNELDIKLKDALAQEPRINEEANRDPLIRDMLDLALKLEGLSRHTSVHAAGVVISEGGMENYVPVYKGEDGTLITQYEMKNAEKVGLVKFDFLGLKTLTVIHKAVELIRQRRDPEFKIETIDLEDKKVYEVVSAAQTVGIFQLESSGMQNLLVKLKPSRFEDVVAVVALFRPGPLGSGMVDDFIERKHGRQEITYPLPQLEPVLQDTYGIILYQEQVQKIAATLANYSLGEADLLRRAMGKKKPEEMAKQKSRFLQGCAENNIDAQIADDIFELMAKFAAYGFNKSHSAAYGLVSYQTAYLKTYFPEEFMAAIMTCDLDNPEKLKRYVEECRRLRFTILPPDVNRSVLEFDVPAARHVGFGLAAIKGIGAMSIEPIVEERKNGGPFKSLTEFAKRINLHKVGKKTLELLVQAGAFDSFGLGRAAVTSVIADMVKFSENHHGAKSAGQRLLFGDDEVEEDMVSVAEFERQVDSKLAQKTGVEWLLLERKMLGVFLSGHPLDLYSSDTERFGQIKIKDIPAKVGSKNVAIVGFLADVFVRLTKTGKRMAYITIEDQTGSYEGVMFEKDLPESFPAIDSFVTVYGSISKSFDGNSISFRVDRVVPLEDVRRELIKKATIEIKADRSLAGDGLSRHKQLLRRIKQLVDQSPGKTGLRITLAFDGASVQVDPNGQTVDLNDSFYQNMKNLESQGARLSY